MRILRRGVGKQDRGVGIQRDVGMWGYGRGVWGQGRGWG